MIKCLTFSVMIIIWIILGIHCSMTSCTTVSYMKPSKSVKEIISEQNKLENEVRYSCTNFQKNITLASKKANQTLQNIIITAISLGADVSGCMRTSEKAIKGLRQAYERGIQECLYSFALLPPPDEHCEALKSATRTVRKLGNVNTKSGFVDIHASNLAYAADKACQPDRKFSKKNLRTAERDFKTCAKKVECKALCGINTIYKKEKICIANKINNIGIK